MRTAGLIGFAGGMFVASAIVGEWFLALPASIAALLALCAFWNDQ